MRQRRCTDRGELRSAVIIRTTSQRTTSKRDKDILAAATAAGVKPEYLKALREGSDPMIVRAVADAFDFDPETGEWFVKDSDGDFVLSSKPTKSGRYKCIDEFLADFASDAKNKDYLTDARPRGPNLGGGKGSSGGDVFISSADARNHAKYTAAEAEAKKTGGRVVVQDWATLPLSNTALTR